MKNFLFVTRHSPHGTSFGKEGLDAVLMSSAFAPTSLLFMDDGVFQLKSDQQPRGIEMKDYAATFAALEHYEVRKLYVSARDLADRGLTTDDLVIPTQPLSDEEIHTLMSEQDVILSF